MGVNSPSMKMHRPTQGLGWCIETRVGVDSRFRVVDAPLDLRFALVVWDEFQHKVRHF